MEHILLAFVCWQDAPSNESSDSFGGGPGSTVSLGVPTRLKDWIQGYPHQQNVTLLAVTCTFLACRCLASALPFHL